MVSSACGRAVQMNAGAKNTQAEVLVFLHADTDLPDRALQYIRQAMADASNVGGRFDVRFPKTGMGLGDQSNDESSIPLDGNLYGDQTILSGVVCLNGWEDLQTFP